MIGQLDDLCLQFPFQRALTLIDVLFQNTFGYTEVYTPVYSCEHYGHRCTLGVGSVTCGSVTELVWIFL